MKTIEVATTDLKILLSVFEEGFIEEDSQSCDYCRFCGQSYGNAARLVRKGIRLEHYNDCPVLVAQDMGTRL